MKDGENAEANKKKLVGVCQKILTAILTSQKLMPNEMIIMCKHLFAEVERIYPGNGPRQVGGYLFLRFFCPAIVQPNAHGVVRPDYPITDNTKRCLLLITKVLQNLSNGILFGAKELYMGGPLNDFLTQNIPILNKFFSSFAVSFSSSFFLGYSPSSFLMVMLNFSLVSFSFFTQDIDYSNAVTPIPPTPTTELKGACTLIVANLRFAVQLDQTLPVSSSYFLLTFLAPQNLNFNMNNIKNFRRKWDRLVWKS